jgi:hypothetical protein|tara:strand:+ start:350 stop:526 length:177 start_codon:yes stop_codon:yes gene_type:complete
MVTWRCSVDKESINAYYYYSGEQDDMEEIEREELRRNSLSELIYPDRELMIDFCSDLW